MTTIAIIGMGSHSSRLADIVLSHSSNRSDVQVVTCTRSDDMLTMTVTNDTTSMDTTVTDINEELRRREFGGYTQLEYEALMGAPSMEALVEALYYAVADYEFEEITYPPYQTPKKVKLGQVYSAPQLTAPRRGARNTLRCNKILHVHRKRNRRNL